MRYITTKDGIKLYGKDWGQGRPVVLAYGWPLSADIFYDLSLAIADAGMRARYTLLFPEKISDKSNNAEEDWRTLSTMFGNEQTL